ncbi:MAG: stage III sporulation protein AF [Lachnospiraceae bacterium]|nr:stage III sporulation protein AF [Lachnospiraceae bacterium]
MTQWMKTLAAAICIITVLLHLIPENSFAKYVHFYAGLLFFLLVVSPILKFLGSEEDLDDLLQLQLLKEEYYDLETAAEGLTDLKNEQIQTAYQEELKRQVSEIAAACGLSVITAEIVFGEDGYAIEKIMLTLENPDDEDAAVAITEVADEITELYLLPASKIEFIGQGK